MPDQLPGDGPEALEYAREHRWEGVVAKKRDSTYQPGRRSQSWIKDKLWQTQEVVIGGWRAGEGGRTSGIGALLIGIPEDGGLHFAGRVGTGFTEKDLGEPQEDAGAAAHRRITFHDKAFRARCQGRDVRRARPWWGRCATANAPPTTAYANQVGVGCGRTRRHPRWCGSRSFVAVRVTVMAVTIVGAAVFAVIALSGSSFGFCFGSRFDTGRLRCGRGLASR